jgi:hypothetical protein
LETLWAIHQFSPAIQAIASILGFILGCATLYYLIGYAKDTKRLADVSVRQLDDACIPYITVRFIPRNAKVPGTDVTSEGAFYVRNLGRGPALNLASEARKRDGSAVDSIDASQFGWIEGELGADLMDSYFLLGPGAQRILKSNHVLELTYESLTGCRYVSRISEGSGGTKVQFDRLGTAGRPDQKG